MSEAKNHLSKIANKYKIPTLVSNCVGPSDNFIGAGKSGVWNNKGELMCQAGEFDECLIVYNIFSEETQVHFPESNQ